MSFITAIGTAVPENCFPQTQIAEFMAKALQMNEYDQRRLKALYRTTKIAQRYSVLTDYGKSFEDYTFYPTSLDLEPFPSISQRMQAYRTYALPLCLKAIENLATNIDDITHIITVSCTGMYAPGLDIEIIASLKLHTTVQRTAINFMGCYGAFNGLKMADTICKAYPTAKVLVVCVELCTLHFQKKMEEDFLLSNALFADGAAAVIITAKPAPDGMALCMKSFFCDLYLEGKQDMAWQVADFGFEMTLTSYIPKLVKNGIKSLIDRLLNEVNLTAKDLSLYAMHPGGRAILEAIEMALEITAEDNRFAYQILKDYGNMSSCTVLFVLKEIFQTLSKADSGKNILSCAFGPGLTLESMILEVSEG
jgi:alpha-pyrone synthase